MFQNGFQKFFPKMLLILLPCLHILVINSYVLFEKVSLELGLFAALKISEPYVE